MTDNGIEPLLSASDIAEFAQVSRGAVSNWRKRSDDFPAPVGGTESKPLFRLSDIKEWIDSHADQTGDRSLAERTRRSADVELWAALNALRGIMPIADLGNLLLKLAGDGLPTGGDAPVNSRLRPAQVAELQTRLAAIPKAEIADAIDGVLERSAKAHGKSGGESGFIGSRTSNLLASLVSAMRGGVLYDPACGIGTTLLEAVKRGATPDRLVGHDFSTGALETARLRAALRGIAVDFECTDVLAENVDPDLLADAVVLEPPFGMRFDGASRLFDDRFEFGLPPRSSADFAWIQHAISHLSSDGRAYVLTTMGALSRGGDEVKIRNALLSRGCVEAVVGLPGKLLPQTAIPLALWILRRPVVSEAPSRVLLIDASDEPSPETRVRNWILASQTQLEVPHALVDIQTVIEAGSVLSPVRWIDHQGRQPGEIVAEYREARRQLDSALIEATSGVGDLTVPGSWGAARVLAVRELVAQQVVSLKPGRARERQIERSGEDRAWLVTPSDVRRQTLSEAHPMRDAAGDPEATVASDLLVTTMNAVQAVVDPTGGHLPTSGVTRLRVLDPTVLLPEYVAIMLCASWNERFQAGSTIQRADINDLELPIVGLKQQSAFVAAVVAARQVAGAARSVHESASAIETALADSVRFGANLDKTRVDEPSGGVK